MPIRICIPINLRQFFESESQRNFFTLVTVEVDLGVNIYTFDDILLIVSTQFKERIKPEYFMKSINYHVEAERNILARMIPLFIKNIALRLIYMKNGDETFTATLSNIGRILTKPSISKYIERYDILVDVSRKNNINCGVCSFDDKMVISFTKTALETDVEKYFFRYLSEKGVNITIEQN